MRTILSENKPGYARKLKFIKAYKALSLLGFLDGRIEFTPLGDWIGRQDVGNGKRYGVGIFDKLISSELG